MTASLEAPVVEEPVVEEVPVVKVETPKVKIGSTSVLSDTDVATLEKTYNLWGHYRVLGFIEQHPFLMPVLLQAPDEIRKVFPDASLALQLFIDAETPTWIELMLVIMTGEKPKTIVKKTAQLEEAWFHTLSTEVQETVFLYMKRLKRLAK